MISSLMFVYVNFEDIYLAFRAVPNVFMVGLVAIKGFAALAKRDKIWKLFLDLKDVFESRSYETDKSEVKKQLDMYHRCIKPYVLMTISQFIAIVFPVIPYMLYGTMTANILYWYPFNPYTKANFPFVLFWIDWMAFNGLGTLVASDTMLFAFVTLIEMELLFLKGDFNNVLSLPPSQRMSRIKSLVDHHNKLLDLVGDLSEIYSPTFLATFFVTSFCLCLVAFQLSNPAADLDTYMFCVPYLSILSVQAFLTCHFGQKLIGATQAIADGIYESGWEEVSDQNFKQQIVLIIQRSQNAKRLTAMGFAEISLPSFTTVSGTRKLRCKLIGFFFQIFTSAYSYFTLLKNVYAK